MHSFESGFLEKQPIPHSLLRTIRLLGEYRGKEALFNQQTPQVLESLRLVAIVLQLHRDLYQFVAQQGRHRACLPWRQSSYDQPGAPGPPRGW